MRRALLFLFSGLLVGAVLTPVVVSAATGTDPDGSLYKPRATQCVLFDTRNPTPVPVEGGTTRTFALTGDLTLQGGDAGCAVNSDATGYHLNLVALNPAGGGNLKAWPASASEPNGGIVNYQGLVPNLNNANAFLITNDPAGVKVKANGATVHTRGILYGELFNGPSERITALEARIATLEALLDGVTRDINGHHFPVSVYAEWGLNSSAVNTTFVTAGSVYSSTGLYADGDVYADYDDNGYGHLYSNGSVYADWGLYSSAVNTTFMNAGSVYSSTHLFADGDVYADFDDNGSGHLYSNGSVYADGDIRADNNVVADNDNNGFGGVYSNGDVCAGSGAVCLLP